MTIRWAHENVDGWLKAHNPEAAVIMFGTNDLGELELKEFEQKTADVVDRCLANGTVVLLTTLPPRSGMLEKSKQFAEAVRRVAREAGAADRLSCRNPQTSSRRLGRALPQFKGVPGSEYEVPTLISRDGVHPSNPQSHRSLSAESLRSNGFLLRNYLTLLAYSEVTQKILEDQQQAELDDTSEDVRSFRVQVDDSVLVDLRQRLDRTRWPDELDAAGWDYGVPLGYLRELSDYWRKRVRLAKARSKAQLRCRSSSPRSTAWTCTSCMCGRKQTAATAAGDRSRLAGDRLRVSQDHRPLLTDPVAHGGKAGGCVSRRVPVAAGLRLLRASRRSAAGARSGWRR